MTKSETDDAAEDASLRWDGRGGRLAILGKKNLTRDGPMIHREAEIERRNVRRATEKKSGRGALAMWQVPRPETMLQKDYGLSFFGGLSSFAGFEGGFEEAFFSACCCCLSFASSVSCFCSSSSSCC